MDEIIQKLREFYNQKGIYFERLEQFSNQAKFASLDVNADTTMLSPNENNYKKVVQKIADELECETRFQYGVLDYAFDLCCGEDVLKVVYADGKLDIYVIE